jgi:hypothetical protein
MILEDRKTCLDIKSLRAGYGKVPVLHGIDFSVVKPRNRRHSRSQRHGQVDPAQDHHGADQAGQGRVRFRRSRDQSLGRP